MSNPSLLLLALLAACVASPVFGEGAAKAHVAVVRIANDTGSPSYDAACKAATDTLSLTLRELGKYEVAGEESLGAGSGEDALRAMAAEGKLDFIVYGTMSKAGDGVSCSLSVYDRAKGKTSLSKTKKAAGVLDIFDVADELVVNVLETMTGAHIGFGSVELKNKGEKGSYRVLVDGQAMGNDLGGLDKALIGKRQITILQKRMLGEREIAKSSVEVKEGANATMEFSIPYLMDDEKAKLEGLVGAVKAGMDGADANAVETRLGELAALVAGISYSPRLSTYKDQAKQLGGEWAMRKARVAIEDGAWEPRVGLLDAAGKVYEDASSYPDPKAIQSEFEEDARLLATLLELKAGHFLSAGDLDGASKSFGDALTLSTRYLGGERLTEYAYAISTLKGMKERGGAQANDLAAVFGPWIEAGTRFDGLREQAKDGKASVIVASDFSKPVAVDGGEYAAAPVSMPVAQSSKSLNAQVQGDAKPVALAGAGKLLFLQDGYASFGKVAMAADTTPPAPKTSAPEPSFGTATVGTGSLLVSVAMAGTLQMGGHAVQMPAGGTLPVSNVAPGDYQLTMTYGDGKSETRSATVKAGQTTDVAFTYGQVFKEYKIGDIGPAGGWVFYDKGKYENGWRYLETAPDDASEAIILGSEPSNWNLGACAVSNTSIESTRAYIDSVILILKRDGCRAIKLCNDLQISGYSDWFLPTKEQLESMRKNLYSAGQSNLAPGWYWSSTLDGDPSHQKITAWAQKFSTSRQALLDFGNKARVRAVRAF